MAGRAAPDRIRVDVGWRPDRTAAGNKGFEAALTAIEMVNLLRRIERSSLRR
jgi:hypothetical protein